MQLPARTMASTMQLEFSQAMSDFKNMFPDMDRDVIEAVLRANQGAVDATIDQLLAMSTDNQVRRNHTVEMVTQSGNTVSAPAAPTFRTKNFATNWRPTEVVQNKPTIRNRRYWTCPVVGRVPVPNASSAHHPRMRLRNSWALHQRFANRRHSAAPGVPDTAPLTVPDMVNNRFRVAIVVYKARHGLLLLVQRAAVGIHRWWDRFQRRSCGWEERPVPVVRSVRTVRTAAQRNWTWGMSSSR